MRAIVDERNRPPPDQQVVAIRPHSLGDLNATKAGPRPLALAPKRGGDTEARWSGGSCQTAGLAWIYCLVC